MLFGKKKQEEWLQHLVGMKQEVARQAEKIGKSLSDRIDVTEEASREQSLRTDQQLEVLNNRMDELQKLQKRQVLSIEDFLEEEQERVDRGEALKQKAQEAEDREAQLLSLTICYQEQFHLLHQQIMEESRGDDSKLSAWEKQFEIVEDCLKRQMCSCALEKMGKKEEWVDFGCHDILKVIDTKDDNLDGRIAEVFSPGFIYHGKIIKKAQVSAYRRIKDGNDNRD